MRGGGIVKAKRKRKTIPQSPSVTAPFTQGSLWMRSCIFRGMGFALSLCNTKVKLAINRTVNRNLTEEIIVWRNIFIFLLLFLL